jgi:hypothetical protein
MTASRLVEQALMKLVAQVEAGARVELVPAQK